jgi:hypothetical protein
MCKVGDCIMCGTKSFWLITDGELYGKYCSWKCHDDDEQTKQEYYEQRVEDAQKAGDPWG